MSDTGDPISPMNDPAPGPLEGITVLAVEQAVAAPFASRQLADLGARVIKIERPGTGDFARHYDTVVDGESSYFKWLNRNKQSVTVDLKHPKSAEIIARLVARADVLIQNLGPGAAARLGMDTASATDLNPSIIVCNISGYGPDGPYRDHKAYDLMIQCETGLVSITGTADTPSKVGASVADIAAGMYAYSGVLSALFLRERTGRVVPVEVSLFDSLLEWMSPSLYYTEATGLLPERTGSRHAGIAPYGPFRTGSGKTIFLAIQNEREWARFCTDVLEMTELASDARFTSNSSRIDHVNELIAIIEGAFAQSSTEAALEKLARAQIATAGLNDLHAVLEHPQLRSRDRFHDVAMGEKHWQVLTPPVGLGGVRVPFDAIPMLGEHTDAVLSELGYDDNQRAELRSDGVV